MYLEERSTSLEAPELAIPRARPQIKLIALDISFTSIIYNEIENHS